MKSTGMSPRSCWRRYLVEMVCSFSQRVAGIITGDSLRAIVDGLDFIGRTIISPGADVFRFVRRHLGEARFQQHALAQAVDRRHEGLVGETNAGAGQILVIDRGVAFDRSYAVDLDRLRQPVIKIRAALDVRRPGLVLAVLTSISAGGSIRISMSSENRLMI